MEVRAHQFRSLHRIESAAKSAGLTARIELLCSAPRDVSARLAVEGDVVWLQCRIDGGWELSGRTPRGARHLHLAIPNCVAMVEDVSGRADHSIVVVPPDSKFRVLAAGDLSAMFFKDGVVGRSGEPGEPDRAQSETVRETIQVFAGMGPRDATFGSGQASRFLVVRRACHLIEEHLSEHFAISDLAGWLGISVRTLERAFLGVCEMSPSRYVLARRLNAAYRYLQAGRAGRETVTSAAHYAGMTHLGRFSVQYREWFGESPNQTLKRARWEAVQPNQ